MSAVEEKTSQPLAVAPMTIEKVVDHDNLKDFSTGLLEVDSDCLVGCCIPCIPYASIQTRYENLVNGRAPTPTVYDNSTFIYGALLCCGLQFLVQGPQRALVRARYAIKGTPIEDYAISCCCLPCALGQVSREITAEEASGQHV